MRIRLKDSYNKVIKHDGVRYDLSRYSDAKLTELYNNNPNMRFYFETEEDIFEELAPLKITTEEEFENIIEEAARAPKRRPKTKKAKKDGDRD